MSHKKFGPDRFSRFDVYWIQTNRQTDKQAKFIYRYIHVIHFKNCGFFTKSDSCIYCLRNDGEMKVSEVHWTCHSKNGSNAPTFFPDLKPVPYLELVPKNKNAFLILTFFSINFQERRPALATV